MSLTTNLDIEILKFQQRDSLGLRAVVLILSLRNGLVLGGRRRRRRRRKRRSRGLVVQWTVIIGRWGPDSHRPDDLTQDPCSSSAPLLLPPFCHPTPHNSHSWTPLMGRKSLSGSFGQEDRSMTSDPCNNWPLVNRGTHPNLQIRLLIHGITYFFNQRYFVANQRNIILNCVRRQFGGGVGE